MILDCILWLKLVSYAHTNYDIRALSKTVDKVIQLILLFRNLKLKISVSLSARIVILTILTFYLLVLVWNFSVNLGYQYLQYFSALPH